MRQVSATQVAYSGMLALAVAMGIGRFAYTPLLPMMQEDYGLPVADGAWLATANYIGYLAGALLAMATRINPAAAICGGLTVIGLVTLGMGFTHDFAAWLALRAVAGITSAVVMIYVSSWCLQQLAALRGQALSGRIYAGVGLGITAAGLLSLVMMNAHWAAAVAWMTLGAISVLVALIICPVFLTRPAQTANSAGTVTEIKVPWNRESMRVVAAFATSGFGYIVPATFLPAMAKQVMHDPSIFGWAWPVFGAAALASTLAASVLHRHLSNRHLWIVSQLLMAAGVSLPAFWQNMTAIILSGLLVGGTFMVITMVALQEARQIAGPRAVGLLSAMTAAFAVGQILGPLSVSSLMALGSGLPVALLLASAVLVGGACMLYRSRRALPVAHIPGTN